MRLFYDARVKFNVRAHSPDKIPAVVEIYLARYTDVRSPERRVRVNPQVLVRGKV